MPAAPPAIDDARYAAMRARDARFDGQFFVGVTSTMIYCRPVCRVRLPRQENCRVFELPARAEQAGFRPCLRCRPELAPRAWQAGLSWSIQDASAILAQQAARLLDEPEAWESQNGGQERGQGPGVQQVAARLGISDRHLRRIFEAHLGVSPLQYLQTRRLLTAKQLLADTDLPITHIALASGFASVRRFNAAFLAHYHLNPTALRRQGHTGSVEGITVKLGYRPPYDTAAMLDFFRKRQLDTIEFIAESPINTRAMRTIGIPFAGQQHVGWVSVMLDAARCQLVLRVSDGLREVLPLVIRRVRATWDLDADPQAIDERLRAAFPGQAGLRVPGGLDGFELAVRAVLGQQVTVAAARTLAQRLVHAFGTPIKTPHPQLSRLFPGPQMLAQLPGEALGQLGIVRQRQAAILALAQAVAGRGLALHAGADVSATVAQLKSLPGMGDWTAQYIAMRALRWPDAFAAGDVALHKALGVDRNPSPAKVAQAAEAASQAWRPWRSYAVLRAWQRLAPITTPVATNSRA